jgi:hypothetical protein
LLQVEADLRAIDSSISIPYWDWTADAAMPDPSASPIWDEKFLGGNGVESDDWRVASGPFAFSKGNWPIPKGHDGPALRRQFGVLTPTLPTTEDLTLAMSEIFYDTPHFNSGPFTIGFRNRDDRRWDGPFGAFEGAGVALDVPIGCRSNLLVSCHERSRMSVLQTRPSRNRRTDRATQRATRASDRISSCGRAS